MGKTLNSHKLRHGMKKRIADMLGMSRQAVTARLDRDDPEVLSIAAKLEQDRQRTVAKAKKILYK